MTNNSRPFPIDGYVRLPDVLAYVGCKAPTWYEWIRKGRAPKPIKPAGSRISAWSAKDVRAVAENTWQQQK